MMRLRVVIVDDEMLGRCLVREYLEKYADIEIVAECGDGLEAAAQIQALEPDLVFLDIQMPGLTGLEVLELTGRREGVIFTTAYDEYALKAFDLHAVDYLLKPFSQARFDEALAQARKSLGASSQAIQHLLADKSEYCERVLIRDRNQVQVISVEKITHVQAQDDYIHIFSEGKSYLKTQALSELEAQLHPKKFVRVHRSYLINIDYLQGMERATKDNSVAVMISGEQIPISRSGQERLRALLQKT